MNEVELVKIIGGLAGLVGSIYGVAKFIDARVHKTIHDPQVMNEILSSVRPYVIFDEQERILVDRGAMSFIDGIEVRMDTKNNLPCKIIVHPKVHLDQAPILLPLDTDMNIITEKRGKKYDWEYAIEYQAFNERVQRKFSIEVIKNA